MPKCHEKSVSKKCHEKSVSQNIQISFLSLKKSKNIFLAEEGQEQGEEKELSLPGSQDSNPGA